MNASQIEKNVTELVKNFTKEEFIFDLLQAYGISKTSITRLKKGDFNLSKVEGEVLYKSKMLFKEVTTGTLLNTIDELTKDVDSLKHNPRFVIVTDYKTLLAKDTRTGLTLDTPILEINKHFGFFLPWAGQEKYAQTNENFADRKASYQMAKLYDILVTENPNIYDDGGHNLNIFLSRLLFCFFAEDTDIFPIEGMFTDTLEQHTQKDGSDTHTFLDRLFKVLNTKDNTNEASHFKDFPYVNGGLFGSTIVSPKFNKEARKIIIECGDLDWSEINPDIFGSMIQAVVNPAYRSGLGMHYTSVPNIMKVIEPLFLNELYNQFEKYKGNDRKLRELIYRISKIKIFDPACGSGNFLIIAYKELRKLEIEIIKEINGVGQTDIFDGSQAKIHFTKDGHQIVSNAPQSKINFNGKQSEIWFTEIKLSQFYGIELDDFAHEMAILSLWLAEHQMNKVFVDELHDFGRAKPILPLKEAGHIKQGNATRIDWKTVCTIDLADEVYILGNPPYLGSRNQDKEQKDDMKFVFLKDYKSLDYVSCWFYIGAKYIQGFNAQLAFVSTNSICQGEQVALTWPRILDKTIEIGFAHSSFKWTNNAKGNAGVTVIILNLRNVSSNQKLIYINGLEKKANNINAYLLDSKDVYIKSNSNSISKFPKMNFGNMPADSGLLLFNSQEKDDFLKREVSAKKWMFELISADEFLNGKKRWCLWLEGIKDNELMSMPLVRERIKKLKEVRLNSSRPHLAEIPHLFAQITQPPNRDFILIPRHSSENRKYIPIGFFDSNKISHDSCLIIATNNIWLFGLLTSEMHMTWVRAIGGQLETRIRYSANLCYNTFPFPEISQKQKEQIELHVFEILEEREKHSSKTLAQLYDPDNMPKGLKEAHHQLDLAIERCYRLKPFESDTERLEYLFKEYEKMITKNTLLEKPQLRHKKKA
ncbi:class I SAM-dependent DNA methyltransferase [Mariniflexile aquimaris]|uniref:site-specific DNA-methyltransferase (adenine-specific) n=1 Tax=Mariniflexile aquimaris TaxID=881009 RepID=A0ABW3BX08_9FLAO